MLSLPSALLEGLPAALAARVVAAEAAVPAMADAVLFEGNLDKLRSLLRDVAALEGPVRAVLALTPQQLAAGDIYPLDMLLAERSISTNTAAGGNAWLMSL